MREFRVLGPVEVLNDGELVDVGGPRQQAALLVLALNVGRRVTVEQLIDGVWGERPPDAAVKTARSYMSRLRAILGADSIVADSGGYRLVPDGASVDATRFTELIGAARAALADEDPMLASRLAAEAVALWRGAIAGEGARVDGMTARIGLLEEARLTALELQLDAWLALGHNDEVIGSCESLLDHHATREGLWVRLMLALYRAGRQADALAGYTRARTVLVEELGLEPGPALRDLQARILRQEDSQLEPRPEIGGRLPATFTSFVGRETELAAVAGLLDEARLVTLIGVGGAGKTRLAIEAAARWRDLRAAPAWFVDLAPLSAPELVIPAVMQTLGVAEVAGTAPLQVLAGWLPGRRVLLLLDNCEHVLDECARLVLALLEAGDGLRVLATSRTPLGIAGETTYTVPPLATPDARTPRWRPELPAGYDAVRLFLERGRAARPATPIDPGELELVAELCRSLDGLPLAIELAAARLRSLSVSEIVAGMSDRFALLARGRRAGPERHQTLAAAIDWSYDLLHAGDQALLVRLSLFRGGFTAAAARAVCADGTAEPVLDGLDRLVDASMVVAEPDSGSTRYRIFETVREYADARFTNATSRSAVAERHARYYCALAETAEPELLGPAEHEWLERLDSEYGNLRAALEWARGGDQAAGDTLARIAVALGQFWRLRGTLDEGAIWLRAALEATTHTSALHAGALIWLGSIRCRQSAFEESRTLVEQGTQLAREINEPALLAAGLHWLAAIHRMQSEFAAAIPLIEEEIDVWHSIGDSIAAAWPMGTLADIATCEGRYDQAAALYERGYALIRAGGPPSRVVAYMHSMAELALATGDIDRAVSLSREALPLAERVNEFWHIALLHQVLAWSTRALDQPEQSAAHARTALRRFAELQEMNGVADALETLGGLAADAGRPERAALLLTGAGNLRERTGIPIQMVSIQAITETDRATAAGLLGRANDAVCQRAAALTVEQLIEYATEDGEPPRSTEHEAQLQQPKSNSPENVALGRAAYERHAWQEALALLSAADAEAPLHGEDLVRLAYSHYWSGGFDAYLGVMERAFGAFVKDRDNARAAWAALMLQWDYLSKPAKSLANGWYHRASRILDDCPECTAHGYFAQARTWQELAEGDLDAALQHAREIAAVGSRLGDRDLEVLGLQRQAQVLICTGELSAGLAMLDEAVVAALSSELGTMITAVIYCAAISLCRSLGDYERAADWSAAVMRWCEREACAGFPGLCRVYNAEITGRRGGWAHAQTELIRACGELEQFGALGMAGEGFYELGELYRRMGALDQAEEAYGQACEFGVDPEPGLALLRLAQGDATAAASAITRAVAAAGIGDGGTPDLIACARLLPAQVEIAVACGDLETAGSATEQLGALAATGERKLLLAEASCARAALAFARGERERALAEATRGRKLWQEIGMPYESARARILAAAVHRALGDHEAEKFELRLATTALERLGVLPERVASIAELATVRETGRRVLALPLTERELEILRLVARGLTDAEIADRLYLSPHTVHRHVANIRTKTNQPSRAAVVAHATRLGVL